MKIVTAENNGNIIQEKWTNLIQATENLLEAVDEVKDLGLDNNSLDYFKEIEESVSPLLRNDTDIRGLHTIKMYF